MDAIAPELSFCNNYLDKGVTQNYISLSIKIIGGVLKTEIKNKFQSGAVRALVALHEREMRNFMKTWRRAVEVNLRLLPTEDPSCKSTKAMIDHVMHASRGYVRWICSQLKLEEPQIDRPSDLMTNYSDYSFYLESLLKVWSTALVSITDEDCNLEFKFGDYTFCIDGMLEHAVMHPLRHSFQLEKMSVVR